MACERLENEIRSTISDGDLDKERLFDILMSVREAAINAMSHGNKNRPEALVEIHLGHKTQPRALVVTVADAGSGFDLASHTPPEDPLSERGRGIPLILAHAQEVRMTGSQMTMTFLLQEKAHDRR